ncbi:MAG: FGGY family carbohydrate kinase, partial [Candidatus Bathyarchaeia archaeon]
RLIIAKDYVRQRIIGEGWFTDPSDALGTYLFDGEAFEWSEGICAAAGIEVEKLPEVKPSSLIVGEVTREASKRFDLPEGVPVVNGAHDPSVENLAEARGCLRQTRHSGGDLRDHEGAYAGSEG